MRTKITLFLISIFCPFLLYSNSLESITYRNGVLKLKFEKSISNSSIKEEYESKVPELMLEIKNTSEYKKNVEPYIQINDKYISDLAVNYFEGRTSVVMYFQTGTTYKVRVNKNEVQVQFFEAKTLPKRNYTIVLDAGHGGKDSGAVGNGFREKDLALAVILKLYENLKRDYNVILTRSDDTFIPLDIRAKIGNDAKANLFVSVHLNSSPNRKATGAEVYYFEKNPSSYAREIAKYENSFDIEGTKALEASEFVINDVLYTINQRESSILANVVLNNLVSTFPIAKRKVDGANFAVLRGSKSPSILVELGFISNYNDVRFFTSEEGQRNAANAIAEAIRKQY